MSTLPLPALIERLVADGKLSHSDAENLINGLTTIVTTSLRNGQSVSIPHIGSFRTIQSDNDTSIEFAPDKALAGGVNAPFSMFEPIELPDGINESDLESDLESNITPTPEPESVATPAPDTNQAEAEIIPPPIPRPNNIKPELPPALPETSEALIPQVASAPPVERIIEKERIVEVHSSLRTSLVVIATAVVISLVVGIFIGYKLFENHRFRNVNNVNIEAEDVKVYHSGGNNAEIIANDSTASALDSIAAIVPDTTSTPQQEIKEIDLPVSVVTDTIRSGRFLTTMALEHYGKKKFWVYIYLENKSKIADPNNIAPNTVLIIPPVEKYNIRPGNAQSESEAENLAVQILNGSK